MIDGRTKFAVEFFDDMVKLGLNQEYVLTLPTGEVMQFRKVDKNRLIQRM